MSQVVDFAIRRPRVVLFCWLLILAGALFGALRLRVETSTDGVLDRASSHWEFYQKSLEMFGGDEIIVVGLRGRTPFDARLIARLAELSESLVAIPGVRRVDSLATVPFIEATQGGELRLEPFVDAGSSSAGGLEQALTTDRIARRSLISEDGGVVALNVILERSPELPFDAVVRRVRRTVRSEAAWVSGVPIFRTEINTRTGSEILVFVICTVAIVAALLAYWFRSALAPLVGLSTGAAGSCLMASAMGWAGEPLMLGTMILPSIMLALGCAYSMHVLSAARGASPETLSDALSEVVLPIVISGATTAIGFAAIGVMRIDAIRAIGVFGAIGVIGALAFSLSGAVALIALGGVPSGGPARLVTYVSALVGRVAVDHRRALLGIWATVLVVAGVGIYRLEVETDAVLWFRPSSPIRLDYESIRSALSGISPMNIVIEGGAGAPVTAPAALAAMDGLARHLESLPDVGRALSLADPLRQVNGGFMGNPLQPLPDSEALAEQYLLLLEGVPQLSDLITPDHTAANVILRVDNNGSKHLIGVAKEAERWWAENGPVKYHAQATGIMYEFARSQDAIAFGQVAGLGLALAAIGGLLAVFFRGDWILAGIALVPNIVPVAMVFGAMGWLGVPLDAGTVVVGSLAMGIAVDDTVHLLSHYRVGRQGGASISDALRLAVERVLEPLVYTSIAIALGFAVLALSDFTFTRNLGMLTAAVVTICLLADLVLLPALLASSGSLTSLKSTGSYAD